MTEGMTAEATEEVLATTEEAIAVMTDVVQETTAEVHATTTEAAESHSARDRPTRTLKEQRISILQTTMMLLISMFPRAMMNSSSIYGS